MGDVNAYYLPGRVPALVDTGPLTPEAESALWKGLGTWPVAAVVVTHQHVDHVGLAHRLQQVHHARIHVHLNEASALERWVEDQPLRERDYDAGLLAAGVPEDERERMRYGGRKYDHWCEPVRADATFSGGDWLELGDHRWEVVDAPGHTNGSFLLHNPDLGLTFSGDTLLEHITPNAVSVRESERGALVTYLETLRRIREREWGVVHPGHGRTFTQARAVIDRGLRHAERRQARILRLLDDQEVTSWQLVAKLFPRIPHNELFLAISEVLGHVEVLRRNGRLRVERRGGTDYCRADEQS